MTSDAMEMRLSRISTVWTLLRQAHGGETQAQLQMMQRYHGAVYRYLLGTVRNEDLALELFQEFALRFLQGRLRHASPERGRFRDYLKATLAHLVTDTYRARHHIRPLPDDVAAAPESIETDSFLASWREELLSQAWSALALEHPTYHAVLQLQSDYPQQSSDELAHRLTDRLKKPANSQSARVTLHRARNRFAELLIEEVRRSLNYPSNQELQHELRELGFSSLCRHGLETG